MTTKEKKEVIEYTSPETKIEQINADFKTMSKNMPTEIKSEQDYQIANDYVIDVKGRIKRIKAVKDELVKPLKDTAKKLEALFKPHTTEYENLETQLKRLMGNYRMEQEKIARAEEARLQKLAEKRAKTAESKGKEIDPTPVASVSRTPATVKADTGSSTAKKVVKFEITNVHELPQDFKDLILTKAMEKGIADTIVRPIVQMRGMGTDITGVKVWEDFDISVKA